MSYPDDSDNRRVLYLQEIVINTSARTGFRVTLKIDNNTVEVRQEGRTSTWAPFHLLELINTSKITLAIKTGRKLIPFRKREALVEISGKEATDAYWECVDSMSRTTTFDEQPATIIFKFRPSQTSETARAAVQKLQTAMEQYRSFMTRTTEKYIDTIIKYGEAVSEMTPFSSVAFGLARVTFDLLKEQRKYDEMVSDLASEIERILPFATHVLEDVLYDETELLDGAIRKLYEVITDTAVFVVDYAKRSPTSRVAKSIISTSDHKKIEALQGAFGRLKEDFDRAVDVAALKMARRNEEFRLLDRLKPTDAANYQEGHSCMEGTRTAILEDIAAWVTKSVAHDTRLNGYNNDNVFWLYGTPGLGKTSVANSLCDRLRRSANLGGSFFCRRDDPVLREPKRVLPTLISKLVEMWGPFRKLIAEALHDDPQLNPESTRGELLFKALKSLKRHPPGTLVLVIDALDECGEPDTRRPLLNCLIKASSQVHWLKVIITSRPEHDIKSFFDKCDITGRDLATDDSNRSDIRLFTTDRMALVASRRHLPTDWPGQERLDQIVERSGGLFVFVETVYRLVDDPDPEPLLAQVLGGESGEANTQLHRLYATVIMSRIVRRTEAFRSILQAIVVVSAYRPLCDETLALMIGLEPRIVRSWVDELSSLLYREGAEKNGIRVRHLSILEFLVGPSCPPEFRVDPGRANAELGLCCLRTMLKELKFNICDLETSCVFNAEIRDLQNRVEQKIPDALQYSCMHWSSHLSFDSSSGSVELSEQLEKFFTGVYPLYWLEVLSLLGKVSVATAALRQMKSHMKKLEANHQSLVDGILRFVLAFYTPISTSAAHIYISGLPFMPIESSFWKQISKSFPELIDVCQGRMQSWPTLPGIWLAHLNTVCTIAYSPNGRRVVSGSIDRSIRIWDAETGAAVGEPLKGHTGWVNSVAYSPDGRSVVSGSSDKTIRIWDVETGAVVGEPLKGHAGPVWCVACSPDGRRIVSGSSDNTIRIWDVETGGAVGEPLQGHTDRVRSVAYSPVGRCVASGSDDNTIRFWDVEIGVAIGEPLEGHSGPVWAIAYSPDNRHVISGSFDSTIRIWDIERGEAVGGPLEGHNGSIWSVAYSPDGRRIVSGSSDSTIRIWEVETRVAVGAPLRGHTDFVRGVAYSINGRHVVSGSDDHTIRIWDAEAGVAMGEQVEGHTGSVWGVAYSPDNRHLVSGSSDKTVRIWDTETGVAVVRPMEGHTGPINNVAYSPDGRDVISCSEDRTIQIWDVETGVAVGKPLKGHTDQVRGVAYSPTGRYVASGSDDRTVRIWDIETGGAVGEPLEGHTGAVRSIAYSPDGQRIVSSSFDTTIRIWDVETRLAVGGPLKGHTGSVWCVAYSPDGRHIVSGSGDNTIRIWDVKTGVTIGDPLEGHTRIVWHVAYSPDGRNIVSCSSDNSIRIWDAETRAAVGEPLRGHTKSVGRVAYSPDGLHIVSGADDHTIRIWNAQAAPKSSDIHGISGNPSGSSNNHLPLSVLSGLPIPIELLDANGWLRGTEGPLFWVPEDCRNGLTCGAVLAIPTKGRHRCVRLDFTRFQYGKSWTNICGKPNREVEDGSGSRK